MSELEDAALELSQSGHSAEEIRGFPDEIERLRAENEAFRTEGMEHHAESKCGSLCPWCEITKQRKRIEELEKETERMREIELVQNGAKLTLYVGGEETPHTIKHNHHVTHEQIDAAWAGGAEAYSDTSSFFDALSMLGIERCGCNGALVPCERCSPTHYEVCSRCNGHGWLIK